MTNSAYYQDLLLKLEEEFGSDGFTSGRAGFELGQTLRRTSNDLRRLHDMGFLDRERRKRSCMINFLKLNKPQRCNKGFEYSYSLSKQGISYLNWLKQMKPIENMLKARGISSITQYATKEDPNKFFASIISKHSSKFKGSKSWWSIDLDLLILIHRSMAQLETKIQQLENQNNQLMNQNKQLEIQNYQLTNQNDQLKRDISDLKKRPSETFKMAEDAFSAIKSTINTVSGSSKIDNPALVQCKMSVETNEAWFEQRFKVFKALCNLD